jgi:hypothetical protein
MRESERRLKVSAGAIIPILMDPMTAGNRGEGYFRRKMAAVRREWRNQFRRPRESASDLTSAEIKIIEARVRKYLYP